MIKLLLSHNVISEEEAKRLDSINDEAIEESIKELGFGKTEHITKEKIVVIFVLSVLQVFGQDIYHRLI